MREQRGQWAIPDEPSRSGGQQTALSQANWSLPGIAPQAEGLGRCPHFCKHPAAKPLRARVAPSHLSDRVRRRAPAGVRGQRPRCLLPCGPEVVPGSRIAASFTRRPRACAARSVLEAGTASRCRLETAAPAPHGQPLPCFLRGRGLWRSSGTLPGPPASVGTGRPARGAAAVTLFHASRTPRFACLGGCGDAGRARASRRSLRPAPALAQAGGA